MRLSVCHVLVLALSLVCQAHTQRSRSGNSRGSTRSNNRNNSRSSNNSNSSSSSSNSNNRNNGTRSNNFDGNIFLEKFGYLDDSPNHSHSPDTVKQAVIEFQRFNGLPVTGRMDKLTVTKMHQPRCGVPDVVKPNRRPQGLRRRGRNVPLAYNAPGYKWEQSQISYKISRYTRQLGGSTQTQAILKAFQKWSEVTPLTFRPGSSKVDIDIIFARREHGDGYGNSFDGKGGTLAHAFFPGRQDIAGDTHFDDDEEWTMGTQRGTNLEIVAAHEFGHALGLGHSSNPKALMAPFYQGYDPNFKLDQDDIRGIQSLYGMI
ncbi:matrix metalloproteinase 1 [Plakobranchus ocellatus]|uniref:Matrix metalloproteinase 1 n=1 Tax=Plakobranchus ocellatus TaxID=259542 RepID=A0AAV4AL02_9GAST|nr:matrix metalloproteinase 1 [Plakobranchus ocellatus]